MYFKTLWIHTGETVIHTPLQTNPSPKKCAHTRVGSSFTLSSRQIIPTFYREKQYCISLAHACQTWKPLWNIISTFAREIQTSLQIRTSRMKSHTQLYEDHRWLNSPTEDFKHQVTCDTTWSLHTNTSEIFFWRLLTLLGHHQRQKSKDHGSLTYMYRSPAKL